MELYRISKVDVQDDEHLILTFELGFKVSYDINEAIGNRMEFIILLSNHKLFRSVRVSDDKLSIIFNDDLTLSYAEILQFGTPIQ